MARPGVALPPTDLRPGAAAPGRGISPAAAPVRLVAGFAGFGAGSVNLAVSSSIFAAAARGPEPAQFLVGAVAGLWGTALLAGAVVFLAKDLPAGRQWLRYVLAAAAVVHLAGIVLPAPGSSGLGLTQLSALLLTLMMIALLGWLGRAEIRQHGAELAHGQVEAPASAGVRPVRLLAVAFVGAVLVAGITTPGLAASTAGQYAVPHGEHGSVAPGSGHHHR